MDRWVGGWEEGRGEEGRAVIYVVVVRSVGTVQYRISLFDICLLGSGVWMDGVLGVYKIIERSFIYQ